MIYSLSICKRCNITYLYWIKRTRKSNTLFPSVNSLTWYAIKCQNFLACLSIMNRNKILLYLFSSLFIYIPMMTYLIKCQLFSCMGGTLLGLFQIVQKIFLSLKTWEMKHTDNSKDHLEYVSFVISWINVALRCILKKQRTIKYQF